MLVSLLLLLLPWAGYQYVQEMERALRDAQGAGLLNSARALALAAGAHLPQADQGRTFFAHPLARSIEVDGYPEDWQPLAEVLQPVRFTGTRRDRGEAATDAPLALAFGQWGEELYVLLEARDESLRYYNPARETANGDRVVLRIARDGAWADYVFLTSAPGQFLGRRLLGRSPGDDVPGLRAAWSSLADGFRLEVRIPPALQGEQVALYWVDSDAGVAPRWWGTESALSGQAGTRLVRARPDLERRLREFVSGEAHVRIADAQGWVLAEVAAHPHPPRPELTVRDIGEALLVRLVDLALEAGEPRPARFEARGGRLAGPAFEEALAGRASADWYRPQRLAPSVVVAAVPVLRDGAVAGVLIAEQETDPVAAVSGSALTRLVLTTLAVVAVLVAGLLGYASWLSWRVRALRDAVGQALDERGVVREDFPVSAASDEIGELSRGYGALLQQVREYTGYLRKLAGNLAHELRTPLAVVSSSLENLGAGALDERARTYAERAQQGASRLRAILVAMSEASRVEQALESGERQRVDLARLLADCVPAYRDVYTGKRIGLTLPCDDSACVVDGVPELLVQMLDKLLDNAADFSPSGGRIEVRLAGAPRRCRIEVANEGPPLPGVMRSQLFEPLVSVRGAGGDGLHLGFGLYIARMIATMHEGRLEARDSSDPPGAAFVIDLPRAAGS